MTRPFEGYRILDMTQIVVGPYATSFLADYGADVIKIEPPTGDLVRRLAGRSPSGDMSSKFLLLNANKKSLSINLKHEAGRDVVLRLAQDADALVYNVRPDAMKRLGLDYEALRAIKPDIIYCGLFGFGQDGPYAKRPAYDSIIQGASGLASLFERTTGEPRYLGMVLADRVVGLMGVQALTAALLHRERTGEGQRIDVPMLENMTAFTMGDHLFEGGFEPPLGPKGDTRLLDADARPLPTLDGYVCITANSDKQAFGLFEAFGMPELKDDPRFCSVAARGEHVRDYFALRARMLATKTTAEWLNLLERYDVPAMPYNTIDSVFHDPHLKAVGLFEKADHPTEGSYWRMTHQTKFSAYQPSPRVEAPHVGQNSSQVLRECGFSDDEISALIRSETVIDSSERFA